MAKKVVDFILRELAGPPQLVFRELEMIHLSVSQVLCDCQCFGFPLCSIESECDVGAVGICSSLRPFEVSVRIGKVLVVKYSLSIVELEMCKGFGCLVAILTFWSEFLAPCLGGNEL